MFSDFTDIFDRYFFTGHFFPSFFFITLNIWLDYAWFLHIGLFQLLRKFDLIWGIPFILTVSLFGAILLAALNRSIIRLYEGYPLMKYRVFGFLTKHQHSKREQINDQLKRSLEEYWKLDSEMTNSRKRELLSEITSLQYEANILFPPETQPALPTKLGNAIRAFELWSNVRYGLYPIMLWSRLLSVIPKEFLNIIKETVSSFNFLINLVLVTQLAGLELLILPPYENLKWRLPGALLSFIISFFLYRAAVQKAIAWGYIFNAAFDLYRRDLLKQLGFHPPITIEKEKELWTKIMQFMRYKETKGLKFNGEDLKRKKRRSKLYE
jgi:hypothetical protein